MASTMTPILAGRITTSGMLSLQDVAGDGEEVICTVPRGKADIFTMYGDEGKIVGVYIRCTRVGPGQPQERPV